MLKTVAQAGSTGAVSYQGTWNASTNVPTLTSSVGTKGYYYLVSTPGNTNLNGITTWNAGDWAVFDGTVWERVVGGTPSTSFTLGNTVVTLGGTTTSVGNLGLQNANIQGVASTFPNSYLSNSSVTLGNTSVSLGSTASNIGNLTLANVTILSGSIPNSAVTGLGTMAYQNANAVAITGGNITVTYDNSAYKIATANIAASSNIGAYSYGNLSYTDIGIVASFANAANNSVQLVMQNSSSLSNASTDIAIVNDTGSAYIDVGIASSTYSGAGAFNKANGAYAYAGSTDLYLGTISSNAVHILANNSNTDAITVNANNTVSIANLTTTNVTVVGGTINVTTTNMTANTASNVTYTSATMQLIPAGYINCDLNGVLVKIPYYNA